MKTLAQRRYAEWRRLSAKLARWARTDNDRHALTARKDARYFFLLSIYG